MYIRDFFRAAKIGDQDSLSQTLPGIALFLLILTNKGQCDKMLIFIFVIYALILYRVFIKYCVFFQEFSKVCHLSLASTRLL